MDKNLIRSSFTKAARTYSDNADIQTKAVERVVELLEDCGYGDIAEGSEVLEVGCGTGNFGRSFLGRFCPRRIVFNDLCPEVGPLIEDFPTTETEFVCADAESLDFPSGSFELIVSCSAIQWFAAPCKFLEKATEWLRPGGFLAISTFGERNCEQIRQATGKGLDYLSLQDYVSYLGGVCTLLHASEKIVEKDFPDPLSVLRHLKDTGVNGIVRDRPWTKRTLKEFEVAYPSVPESGRVVLTYHPMYIIARKNQ